MWSESTIQGSVTCTDPMSVRRGISVSPTMFPEMHNDPRTYRNQETANKRQQRHMTSCHMVKCPPPTTPSPLHSTIHPYPEHLTCPTLLHHICLSAWTCPLWSSSVTPFSQLAELCIPLWWCERHPPLSLLAPDSSLNLTLFLPFYLYQNIPQTNQQTNKLFKITSTPFPFISTPGQNV